MINRKNVINNEDFIKAKNLFFKYGGNKYAMFRNDVLESYEKYNIPKSMENEWLEVIYNELINNARKTTSNMDFLTYFSSLLQLGYKENDVINVLLKEINDSVPRKDTFTLIRVCEEIKRTMRTMKSICDIERIKFEIRRIHDEMLTNPIIIDDEYLKSPYMKDYDFSIGNLEKRISLLVE